MSKKNSDGRRTTCFTVDPSRTSDSRMLRGMLYPRHPGPGPRGIPKLKRLCNVLECLEEAGSYLSDSERPIWLKLTELHASTLTLAKTLVDADPSSNSLIPLPTTTDQTPTMFETMATERPPFVPNVPPSDARSKGPARSSNSQRPGNE